MLILLAIPVFLYLAIVALAYAGQGRLLFPVGAAAGEVELPPSAQRIEIVARGGERLRGVLLPASPGSDPAAPLVLGFGGNAWNARSAALYLHNLLPLADVAAFHYRGYPPSEGSPSAEPLLADGLLIHDEIVRRFPQKRVVAVGFSIGSGVAAYLASRRSIAGAVLVTPFDSLERVAAGHYPWLPVRWLWRHPMEVASWLRGSPVPVAIIAAEHDTLIPPRRTDALRHVLPNLVLDRTIPGTGHNDIYQDPAFRAAMADAVATVARAPGDSLPR